MGQEFELKYRVVPGQIAAIQADFGPFREIAMETTYYDAPDGSLSARKWMLRRRLENGTSVCTLKTPGENNLRGEWETECDDVLAAVPELCKLGAPAELETLVSGGVQAVCSARFTRLACLLETGGSTLELALDRGFLRGGARIELLGEVELELKDGSEADVIAFAETLAAKYRLVPEHASKYKRALALTKKI